MRTVCVAVVLLSLTSVCRPAPTGEPVVEISLPGIWYGMAMVADDCTYKVFTASSIGSSVINQISATDEPNIYTAVSSMKAYDVCLNVTEKFTDDLNNTQADVVKVVVLPLIGHSDSMAIKTQERPPTFILYRKSKELSAELSEAFKALATAHGWNNTFPLSTDYDFENCTVSRVDGGSAATVAPTIVDKIKNTFKECFKEKTASEQENSTGQN